MFATDSAVRAPKPAGSATHARAVEVHGVHHSFDGHPALKPLDLAVDRGHFYTLLGPSGSGKTTLLRIIAGLLEPTGGAVHIAGRDVTHVDVQYRNIGFVFQNYALFPHLTVYENIQFPLKLRGDDRDRRRARVAEMLDLVQLEGLGHRYPGELSGGQQQRVAIARALAFEPEVLLLDEPLGALDRRLRQRLGADLRRIQQETSITAIYVTHDQEEAFILSDTVVVMNHGEVRQIGAPAEVYAKPSDLFVANFLGDTNVLRGSVTSTGGTHSIFEVDGFSLPCSDVVGLPTGPAACSLRPEDIEVLELGDSAVDELCSLGRMTVETRVFLGGRFRLALARGQFRLAAEIPARGPLPELGAEVQVGCWPGAPVLLSDAGGESSGLMEGVVP